MEEILKKANELGLMLKGSGLYQRFSELSKKIEADQATKTLLEQYISYSESLMEKEEKGLPVEVDEKRKLDELVKQVSENNLIKEYLATQTYFLNLLMKVQEIINNPQGDPIPESRIIKPSASGGIITDI